MKKVFFLMLAVASLGIVSSFAGVDENKTEKVNQFYSEFCEGWMDGYCEGWEHIKRSNFPPCRVSAVDCPFPELGRDSYKDGFNRGFLAGVRDAQRD